MEVDENILKKNFTDTMSREITAIKNQDHIEGNIEGKIDILALASKKILMLMSSLKQE